MNLFLHYSVMGERLYEEIFKSNRNNLYSHSNCGCRLSCRRQILPKIQKDLHRSLIKKSYQRIFDKQIFLS